MPDEHPPPRMTWPQIKREYGLPPGPDPDWVQLLIDKQDCPHVDRTDYGVHVEHLGNILGVCITRPTGDDKFTISCPDAMDLRDEITAWLKAIGAE